MERVIPHEKETLGEYTKKRILLSSSRILIPLYLTYAVFALSVFILFIPQQKEQLLDQKKAAILQLTDSALSLLANYESRINAGEITPGNARKEAIHQLRNLRYGPEGKDYFWITDYHPFMIMHPYRPDLEGQDLTLFQDKVGNYPFVAMVNKVMQENGGYVNYYWQWKDTPGKGMPKISYVEGFPAWKWIIGTGIYEQDITMEIASMTRMFLQIFSGILIFIIILSLYITLQVFRIERNRATAEQARHFEELRLKKLLELNQLTGKSLSTLTEFALEEAISLTQSGIGYLAFMNEDESRLTMHTWSEQAMKECEIKDKILVYDVAVTGLWARAARTRKPVVINDYPNHTASEKKGYPAGHVRIDRVLNIPVFEGDKIVALAGVGNKLTDYDESDIRQLQLMMDGMWKILQKNQAEKQLRESEARYRILAEYATDVIWILELAEFKLSYVSPAVEHLLGYTPKEFLRQEIEQHMGKASLEKVSGIISDELARDAESGVDPNRYQAVEVEMIKQDGKKIWAELTARFLRDIDGNPDKILGITRDVTRRKTLEKELRETNTDLRLAQQISGIGNWSIDTKTDQRIWSEEVYRIFERDPEQAPCSPEELKKIYVGKWWNIYHDAIQGAMDEGRPFDIELELTLPSGNIKWINAICNPETKSDDEHYFLRGTIQDITDRKKLEGRIQQSQKMEALGTLAGGIAHDFNNILSSMMGFTELAKLRLNKNPDAVQKLDQVLAGGLRARDLVKHILVFSRRADVQKTATNIVPLVKECLKFLRASLSPTIEIKRNITEATATIVADPTQLHQVLMNLFTNAAYAMKEKGGILDVKLTAKHISSDNTLQSKEIQPGHYIQLIISDTGCGIPKNLTGKIFEPFFTTKPRGEGSGMGLSMVYGIIREMKGAISVYSEPGMGTTFQILLPRQAGDTKEDPVFQKHKLVTGKGKILLVDDEAQIIKWCSQFLLNLGYEVIGCQSSSEALETFRQDAESFDLVLTDLSMPEMTGFELSEQIKQIRPDIPIILCTGFSESLSTEKIEHYGISNMIMKPVIASELLQVIGSALTEKREKG